MITVFLRVLEELNDKEAALRSAIRNPAAALGRQRFDVDVNSFAAVPRSPFAYWVSDRLRALFKALPLFETEGRTARQGLATADDFRFVRSWWAVPPRPIGRADAIWYPFAKGGKVSPFYADIYLMVNWDAKGDALDSFEGSVVRNPDFFFRPGLTWPRRTKSELSFRVMPAGCIFADKGPAAFDACDDNEKLLAVLAIVSSKAFRSLVEFQLAAADARAGGAAHSYEVGVIQRTPVPHLSGEEQHSIAQLTRRAWSLKRTLDTASEATHAFLLPAILQVEGGNLVERVTSWQEKCKATETALVGIRADIDALCFSFYGIDAADERTICEGFSVGAKDAGEPSEITVDSNTDADEEVEPDAVANAASVAADLVSWATGVAFGRFDVRLARNFELHLEQTEPFTPMPLCSPGMLTGDDGLPIASVPSGYPLVFPRSGILVEDLGHSCDLTAAVRAVFEEVFLSDADLWWNEVGAVLAPKQGDLRTWLRTSLFEHHLKRYSKSRRKAPILWQLAVPSGRYGVWLYAHRLTSDSFFQVQNDMVAPKLAHEERQLTSLIEAAGGSPSAAQRREIAEQEALVGELRSFLDEIKRIAPLWRLTLDDGVTLAMAALWRLVPQHKSWQKELKGRWDELVVGRYDWAHMAMHLWPERVIPKCATDRSLAIAHGLEDIFWAKADDEKWKPRPSPARPIQELVSERTSVAIKAALTGLTGASTQSGPKTRTGRSSS